MSIDRKLFDFVLVGGGLQSGLIALALRHYRPDVSIAIVERSSRIAGNHTWSFHTSDISERSGAWMQQLKQHAWDSYSIRVGGRERVIGIGYQTISSEHFANVLEASFETGHRCEILTDCNVAALSQDAVVLDDERELKAKCVIDNRGPDEATRSHARSKAFPGGFQKFWGFELRLPKDWPEEGPAIMDDRVDQADGFRFIYSLPFEPRRVLVEDTRFSNTPTLDRSECFLQVDQYLRTMSAGRLTIEQCEILREESGVLPMPYEGFYPAGSQSGVLSGGYRGGWFHAATGYSFPLAIRFAEMVATTPLEQLRHTIAAEAKAECGRARFARFLNRLLFELVSPRTRFQIFRRFYRVLSEDRIGRFYRHQFSWGDVARIVIGVPPTGLRPVQFLRSFSRKVGEVESVTGSDECERDRKGELFEKTPDSRIRRQEVKS
ncbi:MAG: lycopene beta-cyclase CrtY [Planctomycetota bacterium]